MQRIAGCLCRQDRRADARVAWRQPVNAVTKEPLDGRCRTCLRDGPGPQSVQTVSPAYVLALYVGVPALLFAAIAVLVMALAGPSKPTGGGPALRPGRPLRDNGATSGVPADRTGAVTPQADAAAPAAAPEDPATPSAGRLGQAAP